MDVRIHLKRYFKNFETSHVYSNHQILTPDLQYDEILW